jgi:predicted Rossmann fold nucleotide-binding protein DprA/Smf involved in DNA uptake
VIIRFSEPPYPAALKSFLGNGAPNSITGLGNLDLLKQDKLAIFCSASCPAKLISQTHDLVNRKLAELAVTVIGGFHSPPERECLRILFRGNQPIIICPARSLTKMRVQPEYKERLETGTLLFLSAFRSHRHRADVTLALRRNRFVAALAEHIFVPYAAPASKTERFCREIIAWNKRLYTFESDLNRNLLALGARPWDQKELGRG